MKAIRIYLIGFEPPGWPELDDASIERLMEPCDLCFTVDGNAGWAVGQVITPDKHISGPDDGTGLQLGSPYRCVAHEHDGKVVLVVPVIRTQ